MARNRSRTTRDGHGRGFDPVTDMTGFATESDGSGWGEDVGPVALPDGRLVCRAHGLRVCGRCYVDFRFGDEQSALAGVDRGAPRRSLRAPTALVHMGTCYVLAGTRSSSAAPAPGVSAVARTAALSTRVDGVKVQRGTGRVFATMFTPPSANATPGEVFPARPDMKCFVHRDDRKQALVYTDGACLKNGRANPRAGWAFVFRPETGQQPAGVVSSRLEYKGPFGDGYAQTNNRAELRAVLGALRFHHWTSESFSTLVLATDSVYVAQGATAWLQVWVRNGWKAHGGKDVKNRDLWEALLGEFERWDSLGLRIQFWRIDRALNAAADRAAKQAAEEPDVAAWCDIEGALE